MVVLINLTFGLWTWGKCAYQHTCLSYQKCEHRKRFHLADISGTHFASVVLCRLFLFTAGTTYKTKRWTVSTLRVHDSRGLLLWITSNKRCRSFKANCGSSTIFAPKFLFLSTLTAHYILPLVMDENYVTVPNIKKQVKQAQPVPKLNDPRELYRPTVYRPWKNGGVR